MIVLTGLITAIVSLVAIALDIVVVLLLARLLCLRRPVRFLSAIDRAGRPVTDGIATAIQGWAAERTARVPSLRRALVVALVLIVVVRWLLVGLCVALR